MAKSKPKKPTPAQEAYKRQVSRINRFIREAKKHGYDFSGFELPVPPKRITKASVERLKRITAKVLYSKATYYDIISDKLVSGTKAQQLIRSRSSKKAAQTRYAKKHREPFSEKGMPPQQTENILRNFADLTKLNEIQKAITDWSASYFKDRGNYVAKIKEQSKNRLANVVENALTTLGIEQVAQNINESTVDVVNLCFLICYGVSGRINTGADEIDTAAVRAVLYARMPTMEEAIEDEDS